MRIKIMMILALIIMCSNSFALDNAVDKTVPTKDPSECERQSKAMSEPLKNHGYDEELRRINEIAKTDKCEARDELRKLLKLPN